MAARPACQQPAPAAKVGHPHSLGHSQAIGLLQEDPWSPG